MKQLCIDLLKKRNVELEDIAECTYILQEKYIDGLTIDQLVILDKMKEAYYLQIEEIALKVYLKGLNIDYYPTNFVVQDDKLYYIDYECNNFMEEWSYKNWGSKYWSKTSEFIKAFMK